MGSEHQNGANGTMATPLWHHGFPESTEMFRFMQTLNTTRRLQLKSYRDLYKWSIDNIATFWAEIWQYTGVKASRQYEQVVDESLPMFPPPSFFTGARLNFAENLLFPAAKIDPDCPAIIAATETSRETVTWTELRDLVKQCQSGMMGLGIKAGDRVAGYCANHTIAIVAMLAATSLGAMWTAVSPDTGVHAVLERMRQIEPVLLFADNASFYNARAHPVLPKLVEIVNDLPSLQAVVVIPAVLDVKVDMSQINVKKGRAFNYHAFMSLGMPLPSLKFTQLPADHPVYILYSSGTTGAPKCIVHGAIGTLIQHKKEHMLHCSIGPRSRIFYFTTCTWMMWHWLVSGLASGATIVLYDGSPFRAFSSSNPSSPTEDTLAMPRLIEELKITHFGTSAKYLSVLEQRDARPLDSGITLRTLEAIYSTGSVLAPSTFTYIYSAFPKSINLGSITGGTDVISLFGAPSPLSPVYLGEIQVPGLGMAVRAWDYEGNDVTDSGDAGDLVCMKPFPCQPVAFWGPSGQEKYRSSYFDKFDGVWHHGDFVRFNPQTGGLIMLGRSDGILKPAGVRFGSAEIYNIVLKHFGDEVSDALCIGRRRENDMDETVCLFLKMAEGKKFDEKLADEIKIVIKRELSARHVPGIVCECRDIPVTVNGKKVESAVKQILCGMNVKTSASVANVECLDWYREWNRTHP